jgi:hypothetical protein
VKNVKKIAAATAVAGALALGLAGCHVPGTNPATDDLRNTGDVYPNWQGTLLNVDGFPNVSLMCFDGTAIITNTRSYDEMELAPTLNAFCATKIGRTAG